MTPTSKDESILLHIEIERLLYLHLKDPNGMK